jgi:hypothetical protein
MIKQNSETISLYCVRAEWGTYTKYFLEGDYVAIGWLPKNDLTSIKNREEIQPLYRAEYSK